MINIVYGLCTLDGSTAPVSILDRMTASLSGLVPDHPGPRSLQDGPVAMARVSVGAGTNANPELKRHGDWICCADGRLYEGLDLPERPLIAAGPLERYLAGLHGTFHHRAPEKIEGDFAYALWNARERALHLVRDHVGVRPLYYAVQHGRVAAWASHSNLLVDAGLVEDELDREALRRTLVFDQRDAELTLIPGLKRVPPAHVLTITSGAIQRTRYWSLRTSKAFDQNADYRQSVDELRRRVDAAVRRRLPQEGHVGAHLTSGLDSSSICVLAARRLSETGRCLHTYSFVAETRNDVRFRDERELVDATVRAEPNIRNAKVTDPEIDPVKVAASPDRLVGYVGAEDSVLDIANRDGVAFILSGWGGDEIVSYNARGLLAEHLVKLRLRKFAGGLRTLMARSDTKALSVIRSQVARYLLPRSVLNAVAQLLNRAPERYAGEIVDIYLREPFRRYQGLNLGPDTRANRLRLIEDGHISFRLESYALQGNMVGAHYAFPLLDRELLEFAIRLPGSFFARGDLRRSIFRDAMINTIPDTVRLNRRKIEPFPDRLLRLAENRRQYGDMLHELKNNRLLKDIVDLDRIEDDLNAIPSVEEIKKMFREEENGGAEAPRHLSILIALLQFAAALHVRLGGGGGQTPDNKVAGGVRLREHAKAAGESSAVRAGQSGDPAVSKSSSSS